MRAPRGTHLARAGAIAGLTVLAGCAGYGGDYGTGYYGGGYAYGGAPAYYGAPAYAPGYAVPYAAPPVVGFGFGDIGPAYPYDYDRYHHRGDEDHDHHLAFGDQHLWHAPPPPQTHLPPAAFQVHPAPPAAFQPHPAPMPHAPAPVEHAYSHPYAEPPGPRN